MKLQLHNGLPIVALNLALHNRSMDFVNGRPKRMYGVGGTSEVCYEQLIPELQIEHITLNDFPIQLGSMQESYGFDGIIGIDFMIITKCKANFETMEITIAN